ncbi:MAG: peptidase domain-containing ABC transporter [bacterium]
MLKINKIKDKLKIHKKYYCIKQHDITDCGAACIATIARQYNLKIPVTRIREYAGTDKKGTSALGIIRAAEKLGFSAKGVKAEKEHLKNDLPLPAIAHVVKDNILHYIVIQDISRGKIIVADPAEGIIKYTPEKFCDIWTGILILMVPSSQFKTGDKTSGLYDRFFSLITPHKSLLVQIFIASILYTVMGLGGAFYFKYLIDSILADGLVKTLHILSGGIIVLTVLKIFMNAFRKHLLLYLSQKIDISLILSYYKHVIELPVSFFDARKTGEIISRLSDASKIREAISGATISIMIDSLMIIAGGILLYLQSSVLFVLASVIIPLYIIVIWIFNKPFSRIHRQEMENSALLQSYLYESISGIHTIKAFNGEKEANFKTEFKFIKYIKTIFKATWMENLQNSLQLILTSVSEIIILWIGGLQVISGNISLGQLITFNALLAYYYDPVKNLVSLQPQLQEAFVASDRLGEILDLKKEKDNEENKIRCDTLKGKIEFKSIDFSYGSRKKVLKNINLSIKPGEKVALIGESGSGKTTLIKLLLKYYSVESGEILIDNYNIKDLDIYKLRENIGYVPQDIFIYGASIRDNISLGKSEVEFEEIIQAARKVQAHKFIEKLPLRYETIVGERGSTLSGGQKQRIALARAVLKNPDILILDEATSNLDSVTENAIHHTINNLTRNITTIIIAHRLSTIKKCDKIVVIEEGRIIEIGNHENLLKQKQKYYDLWKNQNPEILKDEVI